MTDLLPGTLALGRVTATPVTEDSLARVEACVRGAADYFARSAGPFPPGEIAADRLADALVDPDRRLYVLEQEGRPIGLLELALHSPGPDEVTIVLLALHQGERTRGTGRSIVEALLAHLAQEGFRRVQLGVERGERGAAAFWTSLGMWEFGKEAGVRLFERSLEEWGGTGRG